jgi:hypothetical protein
MAGPDSFWTQFENLLPEVRYGGAEAAIYYQSVLTNNHTTR